MRRITKLILNIISVTSMLTIWLMMIFQVLGRYIFVKPMGFSLEIIALAFLVSIFIGSALIHIEGEENHLGFDPLMNLLKKEEQLWLILRIIVEVLIVTLLVLIVFSGVAAVQSGWSSTLPLSGIPVAWKYVPIPIMAIIMLVVSIDRVVKYSKKLATSKMKKG